MRAFRQRRKLSCNLTRPGSYLVSRRANPPPAAPDPLCRLVAREVLARLVGLAGRADLVRLSLLPLREDRAVPDRPLRPADRVDPVRP
jgi:hypothetical protein